MEGCVAQGGPSGCLGWTLEEKGARLAAGPRQQVSWAGEKRGSGVGCWPSAGWAALGRAGFGCVGFLVLVFLSISLFLILIQTQAKRIQINLNSNSNQTTKEKMLQHECDNKV